MCYKAGIVCSISYLDFQYNRNGFEDIPYIKSISQMKNQKADYRSSDTPILKFFLIAITLPQVKCIISDLEEINNSSDITQGDIFSNCHIPLPDKELYKAIIQKEESLKSKLNFQIVDVLILGTRK